MRKRVALKILKYRDKLSYRRDQIEKAKQVAARYGILLEESRDESREKPAEPA
jgi:hypothetical protein